MENSKNRFKRLSSAGEKIILCTGTAYINDIGFFFNCFIQ
jgi:hypothetical protein